MKHIIFKKTIIGVSLFFFLIFSIYSYTFAFDITFSEDVSVTAQVGSIITSPSGGSGSGSDNPIMLPETSVLFSGIAYPNAIVTLLKDGVEKTKVTANKDAYFSITLFEEYENNALYTLFAKDIEGGRSLLLNYPIVIHTGYTTYVNGILFPPTISTDKLEVALGDYLSVFGYAAPEEDMKIFFEGPQKKSFALKSNKLGKYALTLPLSGLVKGDYVVYVKYEAHTRVSKLIRFVIGEKNVLNTKEITDIPGDCNADRAINLTDLSILSFWYKRLNPPKCVDVNADKLIDLVDFSIVAFYWTG